MKYILLLSLLFSVGLCMGQCRNGDLETNSLIYWKGYTGSNTTGILDVGSFTSGLVSGRHTIMSGTGADPVVGSAIPVVGRGSYSVRLGNSGNGKQAEILSYQFRLDRDFSFLYALVLQDPTSHPVENKPFFSYWISTSDVLSNSLTGGNLLAHFQITADLSSPFFKAIGSVAYKEWSKECVLSRFPSLADRIGETVTIYFATADCTQNGHYGYAYIDELCKPNLPVSSFTAPAAISSTPPYPIEVNGTASLFETSYYWKINECTSTGTDLSSGSYTAVYTGFAGGPINLRDLPPFTSSTFPHGKFYKITLYVRNDCMSGWVTSSKIFYVN